ncbi:MAG: hypothetical protein HY769_00840 [Candidatus Stahlbacteria bacterium]|nr:hypothetical protein [Candidatus Stahlbacteria bacterium]
MANVTLCGLLQSIHGKLGNVVFVRGRRTIYVRQKVKPKNPKSEKQKEARKIFTKITNKWKQLEIIEQVLWQDYAKQKRNKIKTGRNRMIKANNKGWVDGFHAFTGINQMIMMAGFKMISKPPFNDKIPPTPCCDLKQYGTYSTPIEFKIWTKTHYKSKQSGLMPKMIAQIWVKKTGEWSPPYVAKREPITEIPQIITIEKIKTTKNKTEERNIKDLIPCQVKIQIRNIAENGLSSIPSPIYIIQIK